MQGNKLRVRGPAAERKWINQKNLFKARNICNNDDGLTVMSKNNNDPDQLLSKRSWREMRSFAKRGRKSWRKMAPRCHDNFVTPIFYDLAKNAWCFAQHSEKNEGFSNARGKINNLNKVENLLLHLSSNWLQKWMWVAQLWYTLIKWMMVQGSVLKNGEPFSYNFYEVFVHIYSPFFYAKRIIDAAYHRYATHSKLTPKKRKTSE